MKKKAGALAALCCAMSLLLTGCLFRPADELYAVPQPPKDYLNLQNKLSEVISQGAEYAAPLTGELIQSVQLQDLDGDGVKEAIAFFRFSSDEKPMKIYIYHQMDEGYETMAVIEGAGNAVNSVDYVQLDDDPCQEIVVSWQMSDKVHSLAAYSIAPGQVEELLRTDYDSYKLWDLDQDSQQELVVFRTPAEGGGPQAELYNFHGVLGLEASAPLSNGITSPANGGVRAGYLVDRVPALFVVSAYGENGTITDIFTCQNDRFANITLDSATGESGETIRFYTQVTGSDINGDGIMELPQPVPLADYRITTAAVNFWLIHWRQFDANGEAHPVFTTYHNDRDGWYFILPEAWGSDLTLSRADLPGGGERAVTFSHWTGEETEEPQPFLTIYKLTGANRATRATMGNRFVLFPDPDLAGAADANTIYAAEFEDDWDCGLTQEQVRESFALIKTDWSGGN